MSGIVHTREQEKTLGFSPGVPPCRELLSSKSPMSKAPLLSPSSLSQGFLTYRAAWLQGVEQRAQMFLFGISPLSPMVRKVSVEGKETGKQEGRKRKREEPAMLSDKEPPKTELQL